MIEAEDVSVSLGRVKVLNHVGLLARAGQLTAIVGPNGCGKTTLLRVLAGDLQYAGSVRINGNDLARQKPWQLSAVRAVLPQSTSLAFPFSVREVVRLGIGAYMQQLERDSRAPSPEEALERVDLAGFAGRLYQELSGGEQQRVQLARVLCQVWQPVARGQPRFLLRDEPVSSLDIRHQLHIMQIARGFCADGGGVIAVMHDLNLTSMFADQAVLMRAGRIIVSGPIRKVFRDDFLSDVFGCALKVGALPVQGDPFVLPHSVAS